MKHFYVLILLILISRMYGEIVICDDFGGIDTDKDDKITVKEMKQYFITKHSGGPYIPLEDDAIEVIIRKLHKNGNGKLIDKAECLQTLG